MDERTLAQLRDLQSRAYGPGADIHDDPEALRLLQTLESGERPAASPTGAARDFASQEPVEADIARPEQAHHSPEAALESVPGPVPPPPLRERLLGRPTRRLMLVWAATLVAAVAVTAAIAVAVASPASVAGARLVTTLKTDIDFEWPSFLGTSDAGQGFETYLGLTPVATDGAGWSGGTSDRCLLLIAGFEIDASQGSLNGPVYSGCSAGPFPTTVQIAVRGPDLPGQLRERFAEETVLQFVLTESTVEVYAAGD